MAEKRLDYLQQIVGQSLGSEYRAIELLNAVDEVRIILAASDESTALTTGDGKVTFRLPDAMTITSVSASVNTAPVGSTIIVDVTKNGTSIFSTLLTIDASEKTSLTAATPAVLNAAQVSCAADDEIAVNIDLIGSGTAGAGLKVTIKGYR